ncbi:MAG: undecaprenyl-diphosphate phosphatase [Deltaproteobacteria bacterium]|nr:undecaprenyl-diphosphate phosphatase [Deltaproteobacteria bacterium]
MNLWEAILLGTVQGLTEFLPVSSSGHLVIIQSLIKGFQQPGVLFDATLHFGTLLAVTFFLRKEILEILTALIPSGCRKTAIYIIIATICTGTIGLLFEERIHLLFTSPQTVSFMLLITGVLLFISDRFQGRRVEKDMNITDSLVIGIVQAMALIPGISRSGSTIAFGIFRGLDGAAAARFSFLLSIPAVLGAVVLELKYVEAIPPPDMLIYLAGMAAAAVTGFLTLGLLLFVIRKRKLSIFAYYCWILGISTLIIRMI